MSRDTSTLGKVFKKEFEHLRLIGFEQFVNRLCFYIQQEVQDKEFYMKHCKTLRERNKKLQVQIEELGMKLETLALHSKRKCNDKP